MISKHAYMDTNWNKTEKVDHNLKPRNWKFILNGVNQKKKKIPINMGGLCERSE